MESVIQTMINCIAYEICGQNEKIVLPEVSSQFLIELYKLSKAHDVAHLVGDALNKTGAFESLPADMQESERAVISKIKAKFTEQIFTAVYRYESINYEFEQICKILEKANIPFIPLKGSVIRKYYPEPWMRTSCDIDILVHRNDIKHIIDFLTKKYGYTFSIKTQHDYSVYSPAGVHVELHFILAFYADFCEEFTQMVWNTEQSVSGYNFQKDMTNEFYLAYHVAHMAQHILEGGGCGVKPFIDLKIIKEKMGVDIESAKEYLSRYGLLKFSGKSFALSEYWFGNGVFDDELHRFESFILDGGVYGTAESRSCIGVVKQKNKIAYIFSRLFVSYDRLCLLYPSLKKCPVLMPFYQIRRWFRLFNKNGVKVSEAINEIKVTANMDSEKLARSARLMSELGLIDDKK